MAGRKLRFGTERRWLMVLVAAVLTPLAAFQALHVHEQRREALEHERESLIRVARDVGSQMNMELNRTAELLGSLAAIPQLAAPGHPDCPAVLAGVAGNQPRYTNFSIVDRRAYIVCSSSPLVRPLFVGNQPNIGEAFETGGLGLSGFKVGPLSGKPVIVLSQPLRDGDGRVIGTINAGLSLDWLQDSLSSNRVSHRARVVVFDQTGLVLAASDPDLAPGTHVPAGELRQARAAIAGHPEPAESGGYLSVYEAVSGLPQGAIVTAGLPAAAVVGPLDAQARLWFMAFALLAVVSLAGIYLTLDRLLLRRLDHLSETARRFAGGDYAGRADLWRDRGGLSELARDLDAMAEDLEARERNLRETLEDMAKARAETARFAYIAAHDLQEPLRAIGGFTQLLGRRLPEDIDPQARHYMARITAAAERMRTMFKELMDYAVLDSSERQLEPVDLGALVRDAARRLGGVHLVAERLPVVAGNPGQIARLIDHLIDNAVIFTAPDRPPRIVVSAWRRRDAWEISVRDNGIGIPDGAREAVFHLFKKLDPESGLGGTGIGLSVARRIAEIHGGRMWISAVGGVGCDVRFTLDAVAPLAETPPKGPEVPSEAAEGAAGVAC